MEREGSGPTARRRGVRGLERAAVPAVVVVLLLVNGLYWFAASDRKLVLLVLALFVLPLVILFALRHLGFLDAFRARLITFGAALTYACVLFAVLFPPFSVADEFHHYLSSYWLSNCVTGSSTLDRPQTLEMRRDDWELYSDHGLRDESLDYQTFTIDADSYQDVADDFSWTVRYEGECEVPENLMFGLTLGNENAFAKFGSVLGLLVGKLVGLGAYPVFYLGRIFSAAFFVACAVAAVRISPVGKSAFMAVSFLPMTLQEAASYSYDGGTIGLSFVFLALVLRATFTDEKLGVGWLTAIAVTAALLAPCKAIYVLEVGLVLLIPTGRFASRRASIAFKSGVLALAAATSIALKLAMVSSVSSGTSTFAFPGETTYSLTDLLSDPLGAAALFVRTLWVAGDSYWMTAVGSSLGWLQPNLAAPSWLMGAYVIVLLCAAQRPGEGEVAIRPRHRAAFLAVAALVWLAAMLSMAVAWTPNTADTIQGVQGRYLLPALPLLLLGLRSRSLRLEGDKFNTAMMSLCALNALFMVRLVAVALGA